MEFIRILVHNLPKMIKHSSFDFDLNNYHSIEVLINIYYVNNWYDFIVIFQVVNEKHYSINYNH